MKKPFAVFLVFLAFLYPSLARADIPDPPDLSGWKVESVFRVDVRISELVVVYLGFETLYSNPDNFGEFALVTKRHRPLIMAKSDPRDNLLFKNAVVNFYTRKEREDILQKRYKEADTIICQKWRVAKDAKTSQFVRVGDIEVWFLDSTGNAKVVLNQKISIAPISELKSSDFKDGILAGIKYSIGDSYQIIRAEHAFLVMALKKEKRS